MFLPQPIAVEPRPNHRLWVKYADGPSGEIDLSPLASQGPYAAWSDPNFFQKVHIDPETQAIKWSENVEICPAAVYLAITGRPYQEVFPGMPDPPVIGFLLEGNFGFNDPSPKLTEVQPRPKYRLWARFDDGVSGEVDLSHLAALGGIFEAWQDQKFFASVHLSEHGVPAWGDGDDVIDIDALQLYMDITGKTPKDLLPGLSQEPTSLPPHA